MTPQQAQQEHGRRIGWLTVIGASVPVWLAILILAAISLGWFA